MAELNNMQLTDFSTTSSNSVRVSPYWGKTSQISLDRLSFTSIIGGSAEPLFEANIRYNQHVYFKDIGTSLAEGNAYENTIYFKYDKFSPYSTGRNMRIDMNPSKLSSEAYQDYQSTFLNCISDISVTRLDIAFDIELDLSQHYFYLDGIRSQNMYLDGTGCRQTHYLGTRNSDRFIRLYNKKLELEQQGIEIEAPHLWRLEFELRNDWINKLDKCLDGLTLTEPETSSLICTEELIIRQLQTNPDAWFKLRQQSKRTYYKYRKLMKELPPKISLIPELETDLKMAIPHLLNNIRELTSLKADDVLSQNRIRS